MKTQPFVPLAASELAALLARLPTARVAVLGDFCLDIYWHVDGSRGEASLETGLVTQPVREQRYTLGEAGNVVANLAALGCGRIVALGVVGDDPWGREQRRLLAALGADTEGLLTQQQGWQTLAYGKPFTGGEEGHRIDFGNFNLLDDGVADALLARCRAALPNVDVVIVNQQVRQGIHSGHLRAGLAALMAECPRKTFIVDSRHCSDGYPGACLKLNAHEAARLGGQTHAPGDHILREEILAAAEGLHAHSGKPVLITRGDRGLVLRDATGLREIPGLQVLGRIDTVGAGDSVLAGYSLGLAVGAAPILAAQLGNFVAGVTIQKLNQTGTATPAEVLAIGTACDYIYRPELAEDPRRAVFLTGSDFEIITPWPAGRRIATAIFDHDGTLSTLREGWERVMEPMMLRALLGPCFARADEALYHRATSRVRAFIDQTTGIQTLAQMHGLVAMVREFGCVPEAEILDAVGYKRVYNDALMELVRDRLARLARGELAVEDFAIKNAIPLLHRLHAAGVRLVLASGTDQADVEAEARAMGYAGLFNGGIHGSVGDVTRDAKRVVLDRILNEVGAVGLAGLVTFGDGPVELRETHKRGGYAIGVASDELRRFGRNPAKRARLIRGGADLLIPDFSQLERLLALLVGA